MSVQKYKGRLFPVEAGQLISIVGKISNNPNRFDIGLKSANDPADIILHISARFQGDEPVVVRNSRAGKKWNPKERTENLFPFSSLNPFKPGGDFKVDIFVDQEAFFISIDDKPFCTYSHQIPFYTIQFIKISNDVEAIYQVNQKKAQARPWPAVNVNTFNAFAPGQFKPGNVIVITGIPRGNEAGNFSVNFYDGSNQLRTYLQLCAFLDDSTIILNSQDETENWREQVKGKHPFQITKVFKLAIALTNNEFQVAANGQTIASFPYADDPERLFGSMTGVSVISNNGLNVLVQEVNFMRLRENCEGFESFTGI